MNFSAAVLVLVFTTGQFSHKTPTPKTVPTAKPVPTSQPTSQPAASQPASENSFNEYQGWAFVTKDFNLFTKTKLFDLFVQDLSPNLEEATIKRFRNEEEITLMFFVLISNESKLPSVTPDIIARDEEGNIYKTFTLKGRPEQWYHDGEEINPGLHRSGFLLFTVPAKKVYQEYNVHLVINNNCNKNKFTKIIYNKSMQLSDDSR